MSNDPRSLQTEELIERTFITLHKEKPLNKITVKELCDKAEINRTTFYKHYLDVYDLYEKIESGLFESFRGLIALLEANGIRETIVEILKRIKLNAEVYEALFTAQNNSFFNEKLADFIYGEITPMLCDTPLPANDSQKEWFFNFLVWGCGGFVHKWVISGMKESEKEVADFMEALIADNIKFFFRHMSNDN